jgi:hypothetical protein
MIANLLKIIRSVPANAGQNIKIAKGKNELNLKTQWQLLKK